MKLYLIVALCCFGSPLYIYIYIYITSQSSRTVADPTDNYSVTPFIILFITVIGRLCAVGAVFCSHEHTSFCYFNLSFHNPSHNVDQDMMVNLPGIDCDPGSVGLNCSGSNAFLYFIVLYWCLRNMQMGHHPLHIEYYSDLFVHCKRLLFLSFGNLFNCQWIDPLSIVVFESVWETQVIIVSGKNGTLFYFY